MNCETELLSGHLDGENTPEQERALAEHLARCPACRARLAQMRQNDETLRLPQEICPMPSPEGLAPYAARRMPPLRRLLTGAAALAAVFALTFFGARVLSEPSKAGRDDNSNLGYVAGENKADRDELMQVPQDELSRGEESNADGYAGLVELDPTELPNSQPAMSTGQNFGIIDVTVATGGLEISPDKGLQSILEREDLSVLLISGVTQSDISLADFELWSDFASDESVRIYKVTHRDAEEILKKMERSATVEAHWRGEADEDAACLIIFLLN